MSCSFLKASSLSDISCRREYHVNPGENLSSFGAGGEDTYVIPSSRYLPGGAALESLKPVAREVCDGYTSSAVKGGGSRGGDSGRWMDAEAAASDGFDAMVAWGSAMA